MRRLLIAAGMVLALAASAWGGDKEAWDAYGRRDYKAAIREWRQLAELGDADAQFWLAVMYDEGRGVAKDDVRAHMWYNIAAAEGHVLAATGRKHVAKRMVPAQISEAQRIAREWWKAFEKRSRKP